MAESQSGLLVDTVEGMVLTREGPVCPVRNLASPVRGCIVAELDRLPPFKLIYDRVQGIGNQNLKESVAFLLPRAPWNKARAAKMYGR